MIQRLENAYFSKTKRETVQQRAYKKLRQLQENTRGKNHRKILLKSRKF